MYQASCRVGYPRNAVGVEVPVAWNRGGDCADCIQPADERRFAGLEWDSRQTEKREKTQPPGRQGRNSSMHVHVIYRERRFLNPRPRKQRTACELASADGVVGTMDRSRSCHCHSIYCVQQANIQQGTRSGRGKTPHETLASAGLRRGN